MMRFYGLASWKNFLIGGFIFFMELYILHEICVYESERKKPKRLRKWIVINNPSLDLEE